MTTFNPEDDDPLFRHLVEWAVGAILAGFLMLVFVL